MLQTLHDSSAPPPANAPAGVRGSTSGEPSSVHYSTAPPQALKSKRFFCQFTMDLDLDDQISIDAANPVKASENFQSKPISKPKSQPEPKSTPTPPPQPVEPAVNELTSRTEEEQPTDANQISGNINDDWQSSFENPQEENAESFLTLGSINDFLPQSTTVNSPPVTETPTIHVSVDGNLEKESIEPDLESLAQIDPLTGEEAFIFNDNGDFHIENLSSVSKDAESSLFWEPLDILSDSRTCAGLKVGKLKPNPIARSRKVERIATTSNQDVPSFQYEENITSVPSQTDYMDNDHVPSFTPDEILGSLSMGVTDSVPAETISQVDSVIPETPSVVRFFPENVFLTLILFFSILILIPPFPFCWGHETMKKGKRQSSEPSPENEGGRSSERLRRQSKKTLAIVDEFENQGIDDDIINVNEDNNNIDDYKPENESLSEKKGRKSKKPVDEKEKPVRKRKKASEVQVESTKVKKKFPHSTLRNRRQVNPKFLKISEDVLQRCWRGFPMKELIRLAEHRERIAKMEAFTSRTPALNQSGSSFSNHFDEDEAFTQGSGYGHEYSMEAEDATYYNYRTHMKITPRMKWSKQDTELFYETVQQFGTDLSMIKECFPGRTREQIKSKYKKEEKQQPLKLNDALTTRFKGNSHFEDVIKRLKQAPAQDSDNEDPMNLTGKENEAVATDINEAGEATITVQSEKNDEDMETDVPAVGSPTKSHDSEDDMYRWSRYKSEI